MNSITLSMRCFWVIVIFVLIVDLNCHAIKCPENNRSWKERESVFPCLHFQYHCGISIHGREMEFCALPMFMIKGYCPIFDITGEQNIVVQKCHQNDGCPLEGYATNELYKYPTCLKSSLWNLWNNLSIDDVSTTESILQSKEPTKTRHFQKNNTFEHSSEEYDPAVSVSSLLFTTNETKIIYQTVSPQRESDRDMLITIFAVCGTTLVINALVVICLKTYKACVKRYSKDLDVKKKFKRCLRVTVIEMEEVNDYCEVIELDLLERNKEGNDTLKHSSIKELRNNECNSDIENEEQTSMDDAENSNIYIKDKGDDIHDENKSNGDDKLAY